MVTDFAFASLVTFARNTGCESIFPTTKWHNGPQVVGAGDHANLDRPTLSHVSGTWHTFSGLCGFAGFGSDSNDLVDQMCVKCMD